MLGFLVRAAIRGTGNRLYVIAGAGIGALANSALADTFFLADSGLSLVCCSLGGQSAAALVPREAIRRSDFESDTAPVLSWNSSFRHLPSQRRRGHRSANRHPLSQRQRGNRGAKGTSLTPTRGSSETETFPTATKGSSATDPLHSDKGVIGVNRHPLTATKGSSA